MLEFILAACLLLAPNRDHSKLGRSLVAVLGPTEVLPLFKGDVDKRKTAALLIAVAFREGSLKESVTGDKGQSFCTMQIHRSMGGSQALNDDLEVCFRRGLEILRTSFKVCPEHPVAWYAEGGTKACDSERAQRISRDRMSLAGRIFRSLDKPPN